MTKTAYITDLPERIVDNASGNPYWVVDPDAKDAQHLWVRIQKIHENATIAFALGCGAWVLSIVAFLAHVGDLVGTGKMLGVLATISWAGAIGLCIYNRHLGIRKHPMPGLILIEHKPDEPASMELIRETRQKVLNAHQAAVDLSKDTGEYVAPILLDLDRAMWEVVQAAQSLKNPLEVPVLCALIDEAHVRIVSLCADMRGDPQRYELAIGKARADLSAIHIRLDTMERARADVDGARDRGGLMRSIL